VNRWVFALSLVTLAASSAGCDGCRGKPKPAMLADAAPPPSFDKKPAEPDPRFAADAFWTTAADGDPFDLSALADHEGAPGLLEGLEQGGQVGRAALLALPYADDAPLAYRRLAEIALQTKDDTQLDVLTVLRRIAEESRAGGEPLDPGGPEACVDAMRLIAKGAGPKTNRYQAAAVLRALAGRGALDPATIPAVD